MIGIVGSGAFGTALAVGYGKYGRDVTLYCRSGETALQIEKSRQNSGRLPGIDLPGSVKATADIETLRNCAAVLLCLPMQSLRGFLAENAARLDGLALISCSKGIDLATLAGPTAIMSLACPNSECGVLTGPSFAADIAAGLPTALTLGFESSAGESLQHLLSTPSLRLYRTTDIIGAELGGALKNVMAIAAGLIMGAGLGESARAAVVTRGHAEMVRLSMALNARPETLAGLSGLGDLVLTCTSLQSRNLRFGMALGAGRVPESGQTVEGVATAKAAADLAQKLAIDLPIATMVAAVISKTISLDRAIQTLMSRPLKQE